MTAHEVAFFCIVRAWRGAPSSSTSREAEGTGPMKPRQPAKAVWCQARPSRVFDSEDVE